MNEIQQNHSDKEEAPLADEPTVGIEKLDPKGDLVLVVGESKIVPGSPKLFVWLVRARHRSTATSSVNSYNKTTLSGACTIGIALR